MLTIKGNTAKGQNLLARARTYKGESLHDVYTSFSRAKENAMNYCRNLCYNENGKNFHICSANTFQFSVAWEVENGVRIETGKNSYLVTL